MKFSVIVPTYNRREMLARCLDSLENQDYADYEVIVVDDGSNDNTAGMLKKRGTKHIRQKNSGPASARNAGLDLAEGDVIAFTDDDCVVPKNWLSSLARVFEQDNADAVGGSVINATDRYIATAQYLLNFSSWLPNGCNKYVTDIPTANIAYRRKSIQGLEFNEAFRQSGYTDTLFNYKLCQKGGTILFCPGIAVRHNTWQMNYGLLKFFHIQRRAGMGFAQGGHEAHGIPGRILSRFRALNLLCPRFPLVAYRCVRHGHGLDFLLHSPLMIAGEFYRGMVIAGHK